MLTRSTIPKQNVKGDSCVLYCQPRELLQRYSQSRRLLSYRPFPAEQRKCLWGTAVQNAFQTPFCTAVGSPAALWIVLLKNMNKLCGRTGEAWDFKMRSFRFDLLQRFCWCVTAVGEKLPHVVSQCCLKLRCQDFSALVDLSLKQWWYLTTVKRKQKSAELTNRIILIS